MSTYYNLLRVQIYTKIDKSGKDVKVSNYNTKVDDLIMLWRFKMSVY